MQKPMTNTFPLRLKPGADLASSIRQFVMEKDIVAGWIVSCVGSLTAYNIRFANQAEGSFGSGHFEILSLSGILSVLGSHLHISISDPTGRTLGGHLIEGCIIYTTAEIILQSTDQYEFTRENDGTTPWKELQVRER